MTGTNYRKDDLTSEAEQNCLTLIRIEVEEPSKTFWSLPGAIDLPDHPYGFIVSD